MWDSYLNANYNSLQMAINRSFTKGLALKGAYTYSKAINMTDDDGWAGVTWNSDQYFNRNRARAAYDQTHMFQMGFVYDLPMGPGKNVASNGLASQVLGGWQVSGILAMFYRPGVYGRLEQFVAERGRERPDGRSGRASYQDRRLWSRVRFTTIRPPFLLSAIPDSAPRGETSSTTLALGIWT